jgi:hypothetical protein
MPNVACDRLVGSEISVEPALSSQLVGTSDMDYPIWRKLPKLYSVRMAIHLDMVLISVVYFSKASK